MKTRPIFILVDVLIFSVYLLYYLKHLMRRFFGKARNNGRPPTTRA